MRISWNLMFMIAAMLVAAFAGARYRADQIQATCEDDNGRTVINGTQYVCLSARQLQGLMQRQGQQT